MTRVYVGNLPGAILERELESEFGKFGTIRSVWVARKPPGFGFIEFEDRRDAEDATRRLDGHKGWRVEISRNRGPNWDRGGGGGGGGRGGRDRDVGYRERSPPPRRSSPDRRTSPSYDRRRRSPSYERRSRSPRRDRSRDRSRSRRSPSEERRRSPTPERNADDR